MSITILLVEDHVIVRRGVLMILDAVPDFEVVGEARDGLEAMEKVAALRPDIIVLDLAIPKLSGLEVTHRVCKDYPSTRVVILSMYSRAPYVAEALRQGASAFVQKGDDDSELIRAIRQVMAGNRYLSAEFNEGDINAYIQRVQTEELDAYDTLTKREREILPLAAEGLSSLEIAHQLTISDRTVDTHRNHILQKLGLRNQIELVRYALSRGIIRLEDGAPPANLR
jgi:two-component system response regulator NreC